MFKAEIDKCKKGCGKYFTRTTFGQNCGSLSKVKMNYVYLCPDCQATLSTLEMCQARFEKFAGEWKDELPEEILAEGQATIFPHKIIENLVNKSSEGDGGK